MNYNLRRSAWTQHFNATGVIISGKAQSSPLDRGMTVVFDVSELKGRQKNLQRIHKLVSRVGEVAPEGMGEGGEAKFLSFFLTIA